MTRTWYTSSCEGGRALALPGKVGHWRVSTRGTPPLERQVFPPQPLRWLGMESLDIISREVPGTLRFAPQKRGQEGG